MNAIKNFFESIEELVFPSFKLAIISYYYPINGTSVNGVAVRVYYVSRELARLGCEVHIFTKKLNDETCNMYNIGKGKIIVHYVETEEPADYINDKFVAKKFRYMLFERSVILEIAKESTIRSFDILNTHGWLTSSAFALKLFMRIKWVHTLHALEKERLKEMSYEDRKFSMFNNWIEQTIKFADRFVTVSENLKERLSIVYKIKEDKIEVIKNGVDLSIFHPRNLLRKGNRIRIGFVGRFSEEKGVDILIESIKNILKNYDNIDFTLVIPDVNNIGQNMLSLNSYRSRLFDLHKRHKKRIYIIDKSLTHHELAKVYNSVDIYIQPSYYETFSLTVLEAMACGKPIIATNVGGLKELVRNGKEGMLIDPKKPDQLEKAIAKLISSPNLIKSLGDNAYRRAQNYSWEKTGQELFKFYKGLIFSHNFQILERK